MQKSACTYRPSSDGQIGRADDVAARDRAVAIRVRPHEHRRHVRRRQRLRCDPHGSLECVPAVERARALPRGVKSTSSHAPWPTSASARSPVVPSNEKRQGLRRPRPRSPAARLRRRRRGCPAGSRRARHPADRCGAACRAGCRGSPRSRRSLPPPPSPGARVQEPVRAELQLAAPVVRRAGVRDPQEESPCWPVGSIRIGASAGTPAISMCRSSVLAYV